jgi:hypothetical protein
MNSSTVSSLWSQSTVNSQMLRDDIFSVEKDDHCILSWPTHGEQPARGLYSCAGNAENWQEFRYSELCGLQSFEQVCRNPMVSDRAFQSPARRSWKLLTSWYLGSLHASGSSTVCRLHVQMAANVVSEWPTNCPKPQVPRRR